MAAEAAAAQLAVSDAGLTGSLLLPEPTLIDCILSAWGWQQEQRRPRVGGAGSGARRQPPSKAHGTCSFAHLAAGDHRAVSCL